MPAANYTITIEQGATFSEPIVFLNEELVPRDFTGWAFRANLSKDTKMDTAPTAAFIINCPLPATGEIELRMEAITTAAIPTTGLRPCDYSFYVYTLEAYMDVGGVEVVERLLTGIVKVSPEATRPVI